MNDQQLAAEPSEFEKWLCREMPSGTVIHDPHWWAIKIQAALAQRELVAEGEVVDGTPERIYLQWHGEASLEEIKETVGFVPDTEVVTWCEEKQFEHDIAYVRVDVWQRTEAARLVAEEKLAISNWNGFGKALELIHSTLMRSIPHHPCPSVRAHTASKSPAEIACTIESLGDYLREARQQLKAERARSEKLVEAMSAYLYRNEEHLKEYEVAALKLNMFAAVEAYQSSQENEQ